MRFLKRFFTKKIDIKTSNTVQPVKQDKPIWNSNLKQGVVVKNNNIDYIVIDIGREFVVLRDKEYNTYQVKRNLIEDLYDIRLS
jgi:hypothetical protein